MSSIVNLCASLASLLQGDRGAAHSSLWWCVPGIMDESSASQLTGRVRHSHTAGIAANLAPDLLRQKEEDARISQEDADMEQLMALGMGPARVGTHEEEVCAAVVDALLSVDIMAETLWGRAVLLGRGPHHVGSC